MPEKKHLNAFLNASRFLLKRFKFDPKNLRIHRFDTFDDPVFAVSKMIANRLKLLQRGIHGITRCSKNVSKTVNVYHFVTTTHSLSGAYGRQNQPTPDLAPKIAL